MFIFESFVPLIVGNRTCSSLLRHRHAEVKLQYEVDVHVRYGVVNHVESRGQESTGETINTCDSLSSFKIYLFLTAVLCGVT